MSLFINAQSFAWTPAVASSGKALAAWMTLTLTAAPLALTPVLILLFGLIHFKWLKWITIADDEGRLETRFF